MKNLALSRLAIVLILLVILFALLTQRILISTFAESRDESTGTTFGSNFHQIISQTISKRNESLIGQIVNVIFNKNENDLEESTTLSTSNEELKQLITKEFTDIDDILEKGESERVKKTSIIDNSFIALTSEYPNSTIISQSTSLNSTTSIDPDELGSLKDEKPDKVYEFDILLKSVINSTLLAINNLSHPFSWLNVATGPTASPTSLPVVSTIQEIPSHSSHSFLRQSHSTEPIEAPPVISKPPAAIESGSFLNKKRVPKDSNPIQFISPEELQNFQIVHHHPLYSPRNGTDISAPNQFAVLMCPNQSKCIVPDLQLKIKLKIYLCKHPTKQGVRFYFLTREGLLLHPNVIMVDDIALADYIVYLPGKFPTDCGDVSVYGI